MLRKKMECGGGGVSPKKKSERKNDAKLNGGDEW